MIIGSPILLKTGRTQEHSATSKSRTENYYVRTEFGVGDELDIATRHVLFTSGSPHPTLRGLFLDTVTASLISEGTASTWLIECSYTNQEGLGVGGGNGDDGGLDPLDMAPTFDWGTWSYPEAIIQERMNGNYIMNLASDPVTNPPLTEDLHNPNVTISLNQNDMIQDHLRLGVGRVNDKPFTIQNITIPPYCAKLIAYVTNEAKKPNTDEYYVKAQYTYQLNFDLVGERTYRVDGFSQGNGPQTIAVNAGDFKGFRRKLLNAGTRKYSYSDEKYSKIADGDGGWITEPVPLDLQGQPFKGSALGKEIFLLWDTLPRVDFSTYPTKRKER